MNNIVVGVDVGGSHITAALVDLETCMLLKESHERKEIDASGDASDILNDWSSVLESVIRGSSDFSGKIAIAMPGPFNYKEGISLIKDQNKYNTLFNLNIKDLLAAKLNLLAEDILFINDAESFLQGEICSGIAKNFQSSLGLTLGTGLGSAKCWNGTTEDADLWKSPFKDGIAEDYLSTRWFVERYGELTGQQVHGVKELAALADTSPTIQGIFNEFSLNLASFLHAFITRENPEIVVIGGNIAKAQQLFFPGLLKHLENESILIPVKIAELGEEAALIGAASCWLSYQEK